MENKLTIPEELLYADLLIVSIRTRAIMQLASLNEEQKNEAIVDMINRKMQELRFSSEFEKTR